MQVARKRCERSVVGKPLKEFADVSDPEGSLKASANFVQAIRKGQKWLLGLRSIVIALSSRAPREQRSRGNSKSRDLVFSVS